eukprot:SAG31_NODE_1359_length_8639_cov_3.889813_7_plen_91_part_00
MPFDLPETALSPSNLDAWCKALNYRDFQDKATRIVQYGSRGIGFYILRRDPTSGLGIKLIALYKALSLARKAFRGFRYLADLRLAFAHAR